MEPPTTPVEVKPTVPNATGTIKGVAKTPPATALTIIAGFMNLLIGFATLGGVDGEVVVSISCFVNCELVAEILGEFKSKYNVQITLKGKPILK
jgi:hypothetical protein